MNFTPTLYYSIDHISIDPLDNTRENLRIASRRTQNTNQGIRKDNTSSVKGVSFHISNKCWVAYWCVNGKRPSKSFSIKKYGEREAFKLACDLRKEMEMKYYS